MNESSLKQLIQSLFPVQDDIIVGRVTKIAPLTVKDVGDDKLEITPLYGSAVRYLCYVTRVERSITFWISDRRRVNKWHLILNCPLTA